MRLPLFVALASVAGCVSPLQVSQQEEPIINGTADTGDPAVMLLIAQPVGSNRAGLCTATLVSPHMLLTAAHCVDPAVFQMDMGTPPQLKYYVSTSNMVDFSMPIPPGTLLQVKTTTYDPQFNPDPNVFVTNGHDVGAVVLQAAQTITPVPYNKMALPQSSVGQNARIIGYGVTSGTDTTGTTAGTKRQTNITISSESSLYVNFQDGSHGICEGDSGGPALLTLNGVETIIGVTAFGQQGCPVTTPSADTRLDTYASEIDGWVMMAENGTGGGGSGGTGGGGGTGGSGGTGGTGGTGGSAGTGGTGGSAGSGGGGGNGGKGSTGGCSIGAGASSGPALLLVGVALLFLARRRRAD